MNPMIFAGLPPEVFKAPKRKKIVGVLYLNKVIENHFKISIYNLTPTATGAREREDKIIPRQMWQYLLRKYTKMSLKKIGEYTNRDHSTIIHSCKKVEASLSFKKDIYHDEFKSIIEKVERL